MTRPMIKDEPLSPINEPRHKENFSKKDSGREAEFREKIYEPKSSRECVINNRCRQRSSSKKCHEMITRKHRELTSSSKHVAHDNYERRIRRHEEKNWEKSVKQSPPSSPIQRRKNRLPEELVSRYRQEKMSSLAHKESVEKSILISLDSPINRHKRRHNSSLSSTQRKKLLVENEDTKEHLFNDDYESSPEPQKIRSVIRRCSTSDWNF